MNDPLLTYVVDDRGRLARHVRALGDPTAGRVQFFASSSGNAGRLMEAMGYDILGPHATVSSLVFWLEARAITDVVVYGLDRISTSRTAALIEPAYIVGTRLWFIDAEPGRRSIPAWLRRWECATLTADEFVERWPIPPACEAEQIQPAFPAYLPDCDFLLFAGMVRRVVEQPSRDAVLEHYWQAFDDHNAWAETVASMELAAAARRAWESIRRNPTPQGAQIDVLALQAALFSRGWSLRISVAHVVADHAVIAQHHIDDAMSALYRLGDTQQAALAVITLISRAHPAKLAALVLDDVASDGSCFSIDAERYECPEAARHILRAHVTRRRADADGPHVFANSRNVKRYGSQRAATEQHLQELLYHTSRKTGLPLTRNGVARTPGRGWIYQRRLRLRRL